MGEVIRGYFPQVIEQPKTYGSLALNEPIEPRKRHLSLAYSSTPQRVKAEVTGVSDTKLGTVSYDLDRRRSERQSPRPLFAAPIYINTEALAFRKPKVQEEQTSRETSANEVVFDSATHEKSQKEHFYTKEWVQDEVDRAKEEPLKPGETPWWHLSGTGFWVKEQTSQLVRNIQGVGQESFPDVLDLELSKVAQDFEHFEREYLQQMASLTWNLSWQERDGQQRIICPDYKGGGVDKDGALWSSVTSKDERDGAVYETLFGSETKGTTGVEGWLKDAPAGSFAFMISPEGWSGFDNITYPESQCYGVQKKADGSLQAYTFRYDASIAQNEELQQKMGLAIPEAQDSRTRIKNTLSNVAFITPQDADHAELEGRTAIRSFGDFIDLMQESVGGRDVAYGEGGGVKTFDEIKSFITTPDTFIKKHQMTEKLSQRFSEYAKWRIAQGGTWQAIEQDLQIAMAFGPLHLNQAYDMEGSLNDLSGGNMYESQVSTNTSIENALIEQSLVAGGFDYKKEKEELEKKPGCAGGGGGTGKNVDSRYASKFTNSMGASRVAEAKSDEMETFSCPRCTYVAPKGVAVGDTCPGCQLTKEEFAKESGIEC